MMTLARSFREFRGASSFSTWLYTIDRSLCIKNRRKRKLEPDHIEPMETLSPGERERIGSPLPDPEKQLETAEVWQLVHAGIHELDPSHREVLVLRDIEGLRAKEVAEIVGISVAAVKSRLHRARSDLRDSLMNHAYSPKPGCPDIRQVFSEHLEGDLSPDICSTMELHVANCPICAAECSGLQAALNACSTASVEVPPQVQKQVRAAIRQVLLAADP